MCVFCAAVPVAGTVGVNLHNKQRVARRKAEEEGRQPAKEKPIAKLTAASIALLVICSAVYHLYLQPHLRI